MTTSRVFEWGARPRVLYFFLFAFLATPGRFTSVFLKDQFAFDETEVGLVMAFPTALSLFSLVAGGALADTLRGGKARLLLFCAAASAAFFHLLSFIGGRLRGAPLTLVVVALYSFSRAAQSSTIPSLDAYTLQHLSGEVCGGDAAAAKARWGQERLWGAVSWGIMSVVMGVLFDYTGRLYATYAARLVTGAVFVVCIAPVVFAGGGDALSRGFAPVPQVEDGGGRGWEGDGEGDGQGREVEAEEEEVESGKGHGAVFLIVDEEGESSAAAPGSGPEPSTVLEFARFLFSRVQSVAFLLVMTVLSAGSALVEGMVFLFFAKDLEASNTLLGITVAVTVSFEIPLFYMGAWLHRALSGTSMLLVAMACYCSRVYYYTLVGKEHAWYVLLLEPLHGVTYALSASASVSEMSRLAPPHLQATGQSFLSVARMIGSVIGTVGGGYVMQHHGSLVLYRGAAVIVAVAAVLYGLTMRCVGTGTDEST